MLWEFPGGPVVRIHASTAGARFSLWAGDQNPETVTKHGQKKKKQTECFTDDQSLRC